MKTTHELATAVYALGWLEGHLEDAETVITSDPTATPSQVEYAQQAVLHFGILNTTFLEVVNQLRDAEAKLKQIESTLGN